MVVVFLTLDVGLDLVKNTLMEVSLVFFFSTSLVRRWGKQTWQEMEHHLVN